jgi:hypothetical protein
MLNLFQDPSRSAAARPGGRVDAKFGMTPG